LPAEADPADYFPFNFITMDTLTEKKKTSLDEIDHAMFSMIPGMPDAAGVPVLDAACLDKQEFLTQWVDNNRPCLIRGAIRHWPAVEKWRDKNYWLAVCSNFNVCVFPHENHVDYSRIKSFDLPLHEAIERLFEGRDHIFSIPAEKIDRQDRFFNLLEDMKGFSFLPSPPAPRNYDRQRIFIYRRASTAWHYHPIDETLMCQVNGGKRVGLLPPDIPRPQYVTDYLHNEGYLDGKSLDLALKPMVVDVDEGDALYIPPFWHHGVVPKDARVGFTVAFCWASPWHKMGDLSNYFVRKLYKDALWPIKKISPVVPFLGLYAGLRRLSRFFPHR
jgi:hypothetical protein